MPSRWGGIALIGVATATPSSATAQSFLNFRNVPIIATQSPDVFLDLFARGHCGTIRGLIFGDSQETCPYGRGSVYVPRLNYELFVRYGNTPETPLMGPTAHTGGGAPWAQWLVRNANVGPGLTSSRLPSAAIPPFLGAGKSTLTNGSNINDNQIYGGLYVLQLRAEDADPGTLLPGAREFLTRSDAVYIDVFGATNVSSGEVVARISPSNSPAPNYFQPTVSITTLSMGLESNTSEIRRQRIGPLNFNNLEYMQVELFGSLAHKYTDIIGARFVNGVDDRGWAISSLAAGGYQTQNFIGFHSDCGPVLAAFEPDVVFLAFGANDFGNGQIPTQFHANTLELIHFLRGAISPDLPVILLADPDRDFAGTPTGSAENSDFLSGVLCDIALNTPGVCAVNSRLLTHQHGWTRDSNLSEFLTDSVHYNSAGARLKAQLEIDALYSAFGRRCLADLCDSSGVSHPDCSVTIDDLLFFLFAFEQGADVADLDDDGDPSSANPNGAVEINDLLFFLARFESGC